MIKQEKGNNIVYLDNEMRSIGAGFKTNLDTIALVKCPKCYKENYSRMVLPGICAWCGFDANGEKND